METRDIETRDIETRDRKDDLVILFVVVVSSAIILATVFLRSNEPIQNLIMFFFSSPTVIIFNFLWFLLFSTIFLPLLSGISEPIKKKDKYNFAFLIAVLGFFIDFAYRKMIWVDESIYPLQPSVNITIQFTLILFPIFMYWLSGSALSRSIFGLGKKQSVLFGFIMACFNPIWLAVVLPYIQGNVIT